MQVRSLVVSIALAAVVVLTSRPAAASDPNKVFSGQIIMSTKRFPGSAKSPDAYIAQVRKLSQSNFIEDKEDHSWTIWLAAFLKTPLNDVEYTVKIYELQGKAQQFLAGIDQYTDTRGEKTVITKIKLDKQSFGVNKQLMITVENKGKVLASGLIKIIGEGEHFSGKVNFSDDDASGKDADDAAKKK